MFNLALFAFSAQIIVRDALTHRISNVSILCFTALQLFSPHPIHATKTFFAISLASILFTIARIGMGDLKLLIGLLITQGAIVTSLNYLYLTIVALVFTLISQLIFRRSLQGSVAFAHVLLLPFLIGYLAI
ncbi:hypothetical protein MCEJIRE27_00772 [Candidatus Nanopelagicaceae bacterium]